MTGGSIQDSLMIKTGIIKGEICFADASAEMCFVLHILVMLLSTSLAPYLSLLS